MPHQPRIATCSYCGTRAAFVLRGDVLHELTCSACGAQLHDLKALKSPPKPKPEKNAFHNPRLPVKSKKKKKKKSPIQHLLDELWDEIEDIFD